MFLSIVIPTYNRQPILAKCLQALEQQHFDANTAIAGYEIVVVDDGSTDGTLDWLRAAAAALPHVVTYVQEHGGPAGARNLGVERAQGDTIIFIDSDLVVTPCFLQAHATALRQGAQDLGSDRLFTYGAVINTCNFEEPTSEPYKLTDFSAAYFATGNVAIARRWLLEAGLFDTQFQLYGWEDLELGVRLKKLGLKLIKCPEAVGVPARRYSPADRKRNSARAHGGPVLPKTSHLGSPPDDPDDLATPSALGPPLPRRPTQ